jgi:hypothetical protein
MSGEEKNTIEVKVPEEEVAKLKAHNEALMCELDTVRAHFDASKVSDEVKVKDAEMRLSAENAALKKELQAISEHLRTRPSPAASIVVSERRAMKGRVADEARYRSLATQKGRIVTFREVCDILNQNYNYEEAIKSTTLDIISVYLKGQKILYIEAKTYCEQQLYALMLPTIAITALCSVISVVLKDFGWGAILVSGLTATNTFVLSLITYLKLDAKAEAHKTSAYSYESLQSSCEFSSGKILLQGLAEAADDVSTSAEELVAAKKTHEDLMNMIEVRVKEIKDSNKFVLPEVIRHKYPVTYGTNVFSEVKKLQNQEIILINKLKVIVNRIYKLEGQEETMRPLVYKQQIDDLNVEQDVSLDEIIRYRNTYLEIDSKFKGEIETNVASSRRSCGLCRWLKT